MKVHSVNLHYNTFIFSEVQFLVQSQEVGLKKNIMLTRSTTIISL